MEARRIPGDTAEQAVPGALVVLALATAAVLVWAVVTADPADLSVFVRAGREVVAGRTPYATPGTPAVWSGSAFVYPWVVALPFAALGLAPNVVVSAAFRGMSIAAVAAGCRLAGSRRPLATLAVMGSSVLLLGLQQGTLDSLLFFGVVLAWRWRERPALLCLTLGALVVSELFMWPLLVWAWFTSRRKAAVSATVVGVAVILVGSLAGEPLPGYLRSLSELSRHEGPHSVSFFALAIHAGLHVFVASALALVAGMAVLWAGIAAERRTARPVGLAGALCAALVAMPILWSHYLLLLALPLLLAGGAGTAGATTVALLGLFDVASWARYTPYHSSLPEVLLGSAVAVAILAIGLWELLTRDVLPGWLERRQLERGRVGHAGFGRGLACLPLAFYGLLAMALALAILADARGFRIVVVQVAIVIVATTGLGTGPHERASLVLTRTR